MDLHPEKRTNSLPAGRDGAQPTGGDGISRGIEFALLLLMFLGVGYVLDRWFDTKPVFMVVFVALALVGHMASMYYGYEARMKELEAKRAEGARGGKATLP